MLQNWLILLPELSLLSFLPVAWLVNMYRESKTAKTFFTLSKYFLLAALVFTIVFYNKSVWGGWWLNNRYSTLFKVAVYLVALVWFYLSSKWFLNKNRSSLRFYAVGMTMLLLFGVLLSAQNFAVPVVLVPALCLLTRLMILQHWDEERVRPAALLYGVFALLFSLLLWGGAFILWQKTGSLEYADIQRFLAAETKVQTPVYAAVVMITALLLFMMAAAPFHFWFVGALNVAILPVCGFLTLIPPFVYLSCLITLMTGVFAPLSAALRPLLFGFAVISLFIGAISANRQDNLRRLFAFSTTYNLGFMLLGILAFHANSVVSAFVYTIIYVLSMTGIYTVFLGLKSKGDYLDRLEDIGGLSEARPYLAAALLIFMVSLIGVPPLVGFWGRLSLINTLAWEERWGDVLMLMVALVLMANAYLQVIRTVYFQPLKHNFDRTDKAIYICLFINLALVLISILNPAYLLHDAELVLQGVSR